MKLGFVCLPLSGHLLPMTALMRKVRARGHEVVHVGVPDMEGIIRDADLPFLPYGAKLFPRGSMPALWEPIGQMHGLEVLRYAAASIFPPLLDAALKELPDLLVHHEMDGLVVDMAQYCVQLAAMSVGVPFVQAALALRRDPTGTTPPLVFSWPHETTPEALARNTSGLKELGEAFSPTLQVGHAFAAQTKLALDWKDPGAMDSKLAVLTQTPREFDFPIVGLPPHWHYAGPFQDGQGRRVIAFPWEDLDGRPLVYVSLGTLVNGLERLYRTILEAVAGMTDLQVVVSTGGRMIKDGLAAVSPDTIIVEQAPQLELLKHATLCITHAGLNTALEALAHGVPMVAIPIGFDQPGVAARIAYHHVGEFIEVDDLTVQGLSVIIRKVLDQPEYRENARRFQRTILQDGGLEIAAEIVENAFDNVVNGGGRQMNATNR